MRSSIESAHHPSSISYLDCHSVSITDEEGNVSMRPKLKTICRRRPSSGNPLICESRERNLLPTVRWAFKGRRPSVGTVNIARLRYN